jgi:acetolactate synthase-1/2/3 large subunit
MSAGTPTVGEALVSMLEQAGVDTVFGIPGVHTIELYRGLAASSIRHITPRTNRARASWRTAMPG